MDFYAFCHPEIVPSPTRRDALQRIEGIKDLRTDDAAFGWDDQWCPRGDSFHLAAIQVEIGYNTVDWIRTVVRKVREEGATSIPELKFRPYSMLGLMENSLIVYDPDLVLRNIRSCLRPYPSKLKHALLSQNLQVARGSLGDLQDYVERNIGNTAFHFQMERIAQALGSILFALNERYDPMTKRVEEEYRQLRIVPEDFLRRYGSVLETPLTPLGRREIVNALQGLVDEIGRLAKEEAEPGAPAEG
jgi:hypothetical protein